MMKNIWLLITLILFCSCQKENIINGNIEDESYSALSTGNYWVYEKYQIDDLGNEILLDGLDSCYVEKDTIINGLVYYKMVRPHIVPSKINSYLRDSSDCIVDSTGRIIFSYSHNQEILFVDYITASVTDTICRVEYYMENNYGNINVSAGNFYTRMAVESYNFYPNWQTNGVERQRRFKYAENIGIITEILPFFLADNYYRERRLLQYNVN
jgi:hypothetical protein